MAYSIGDSVDKNDDYAIRWIRAAADRELVMAQLTLGMKYATGDEVKKDLETAVSWLHRASISGSNEATLQLRKYENRLERLRNPPAAYIPDSRTESVTDLADRSIQIGEVNSTNFLQSVPLSNANEKEDFSFDLIEAAMSVLLVDKDPEKAKNLLETPALGGNPIASRQLALIHYKQKIFKDAKKWFDIAALKNDPESLRYLGIMYFLGQGVEQDYAVADSWLTKAAQLGDLEASRYLRIVKQFY
jgi:TPR repeat protein